MTYYLIINCLGLLSFFLLFYRFPKLGVRYEVSQKPNGGSTSIDGKISIVIPMRNERFNIEQLLNDLLSQQLPPHEIICVDDMSDDDTVSVVSKYHNVTLLQVEQKQKGWNAKAWACQVGARNASGDFLLFLDADVRLGPTALKLLYDCHIQEQCTITVQPFHNVRHLYERCSLFFNLVQLAGNGSCSAIPSKAAGLFGPVIFIDRNLYNEIGGHSCVNDSVVDDLKLGQHLDASQEHFVVKTGGDIISFRMYPDGMKSLAQGWIKNIAVGAEYTSLILFVLTFLWLTGCAASLLLVYKAVESLFMNDNSLQLGAIYVSVSIAVYLVWAIATLKVTSKVGSFGLLAPFLYPIWLLTFFTLFSVSLFKRIFKLSVSWKGRKIKQGR